MRSWETWKRRFWLVISASVVLGLGGILALSRLFVSGPEPGSTHSRVRVAIPVQEATKRQVHLYFAPYNGRYLQAEERRIEAADISSAAEAIVRALIEGPENPKLVSVIPPGTQLLRLFVAGDGTAYEDFTPELSRQHPGGVAAERLTLYAIVNSLVLNLDKVERVQLLLDGSTASTLAGHLDIRFAKTADLLLIR